MATLTVRVVIAQQKKHALAHIYNKVDAVRNSVSNLPKLLSVLDILTPNETSFLQSVLATLPARTMKDLGCYSYIFEIILGKRTLPYWFLRNSRPDEAIQKRYWYGFPLYLPKPRITTRQHTLVSLPQKTIGNLFQTLIRWPAGAEEIEYSLGAGGQIWTLPVVAMYMFVDAVCSQRRW